LTIKSLEEIQNIHRTDSEWTSPKGFNKDSLPWRLWEKAIKNVWDPRDIDWSQDKADWDKMTDEQRFGIAGLARGFMVGEEGVTLDILPLVMAMADEGRVEETMYLTTFAFEEAKHIDMFRMWFDTVDFNFADMQERMRARARERGVELPNQDPNERRGGMFEQELPKVMRRLLTDRSPRAFLDAAVTYNQFVEGCLALAGYKVWNAMFSAFGVLPGLQKGLTLTQKDERRHIAYGTYLARRLIAKNPELFDFAKERMYELRDSFYGNAAGNGQAAQAARAAQAGETNGQQGNGQGGGGYAAAGPMGNFAQHAINQVDRRIEVMRKAMSLTPEQAEFGAGTEEAEVELENVPA
jgi:ribonucleoside-diphosphate reductase beta chain